MIKSPWFMPLLSVSLAGSRRSLPTIPREAELLGLVAVKEHDGRGREEGSDAWLWVEEAVEAEWDGDVERAMR